MRWLFLGIGVMALGLVAFGTLNSKAPEAPEYLQKAEGRFVALVTEPAAKDRAGRKADEAPPADADPVIVDGTVARGEEGAFGDSKAPGGDRDVRSKSDKSPQPTPAPIVVAKAEAARVAEEPEEPEEEEIDEDGRDDDGEVANMPPPPPPRVAKPAPIARKVALGDDGVRPAKGLERLVESADKAQVFHFATEDAAGDLSGERERGRAGKKRKPGSKRRSVITLDAVNLDDGALDDSKTDPAQFAAQGARRALPDRLDLSLLGTSTTQSTVAEAPPTRFLPRMCYFENTYLGGNAAWQEQLRRVQSALGHLRPLRYARLDAQAFDPPTDAGMALTASLDHAGLQQPGRVVLQVGLQGSQRFGWRRPPLDVVLVVDGPVTDLTAAAAKTLLARLSPRDRLGVVEAGRATPIAAVADLRTTRDLLVDHTARAPGGDAATLVRAMDQAGTLLKQAASDAARIPGSQTVIVLTRDQPRHAQAARAAAHRLQTQGAVVSVIDLGANVDAGWWAVANAGHGNFHRAAAPALGEAFDAELATLSKVVARLLRVNVRLGPHTEGIRVIGSRVLGQQEVKAVKAREKATDRNLSKTMGLKADRGEDDDGIQTVIPYFYGGDSHVILVELWVDPGKASLESAVAEITLKYKDMVNLSNATARAAVFLDRRPKPDARAQRLVKQNVDGFAFAEALDRAAQQAGQGRWPAVKQTLRNHAHTARDRKVVAAFEALIGERSPAQMQQALALASQQRKGTSNGVDR